MVCSPKASQEPLEGLPDPVITFEGHAGQARMTLEEGLVVVLAVVAGTLLFIGLAQALEARPAPARPARRIERPRPWLPEAPRRPPYTGPERRRSARGRRPAPSPPPITSAGAGEPGSGAVPVAAIQPDLPVGSSMPSAEDAAVEAVDTCFTLYQEGQHGSVFDAVAPHLVEPAAGTEMGEPSFTRAALWTIVGLSRHAMGDVEGAQAALDRAVREAPDGAAEGCPQRIALLAAPAARRLLAASEAMDPTAVERLAVLRVAVLWLEWRIVAAPATEEVSDLLDKGREALWDGYGVVARAMVRRKRFADSRALVRQALDSEELPGARRAPLGDLASVSLVREIGRLTARARGTATPEPQALDSLERARDLLAGAPPEGLGPSRWHGANRRIWRGYTRLAQRHLEAFELEAALPPLFRALHLGDLDLGLDRQTRELLARTIERVTEKAGESISRLLKEGNREAAMERWQYVRSVIQKARDQGLSHEQLAVAFARARQMLEQIEEVNP